MAKKNGINIIYLIGAALILFGACFKTFELGFVNWSIFKSFDDFNTDSIGSILLAVGSIAGIVLSFVKIGNAKLLKLVAIIAAIVGCVIVVTLNGNIGIKYVFKVASVGFYAMLAGFVLGIVGAVTEK